MKYITVLDFEAGRVFQYDVVTAGFNPETLDEFYEGYITDKGHNLANCEWMIHENPQVITN